MNYPFARCSAGQLSKVTEIRNDLAFSEVVTVTCLLVRYMSVRFVVMNASYWLKFSEERRLSKPENS